MERNLLNNVINNNLNKIASELCNSSITRPNNLMGGSAGIVIFLLEYYKHTGNEIFQNHALKIIEGIFKNMEERESHYSFASGLSGLGWMLEYLEQSDFLDVETNDVLNHFDGYLQKVMNIEMLNGNYDYLHGAIGIGLYFTRRINKSEIATNALKQLFRNLESSKCEDDNTSYWPYYLEGEIKTKTVNLGIAHGVPVPPTNPILTAYRKPISFACMKNLEENRLAMGIMIADWRVSGKTKKGYCLENGINQAKFYYWYARFNENTDSPKGFIPISGQLPDKAIELTYPNGVKLRAGIDLILLAELIHLY